jgi:hypothetical protein
MTRADFAVMHNGVIVLCELADRPSDSSQSTDSQIRIEALLNSRSDHDQLPLSSLLAPLDSFRRANESGTAVILVLDIDEIYGKAG